MIQLFLFIIGLMVGSFINVVTLRYKPGSRLLDPHVIGGRSFCPHCHKSLSWYELIPILSFIIQGARCRSCQGKISFQYPLVELICGIIFVAVPWYFFSNLGFSSYNFSTVTQLLNYQLLLSAIWILVFLSLVIIFIIDFRRYIIPDQINLFLIFLGILLIVISSAYHGFDQVSSPFLKSYAYLFGWRDNIWINYLFAALISSIAFSLLIILSRGRAMGWGDAKLAFALGMVFGWPEILMILMLSFLIGAIGTLPLLIRGKKSIKDTVPFGPFMVAAAFITFFFGYSLIYYYFQLFGIYFRV